MIAWCWIRNKLMGDPNPLADLTAMHPDWLKDSEKIAQYSAWTEQENGSMVVRRATCQHEDFWAMVREKEQARKGKRDNVATFHKKASA